jgi:hypothetical protein
MFQSAATHVLSSVCRVAVAGLYFWNWLPCVTPSGLCAIGPKDNAESPQGKTAEGTVRSYYKGKQVDLGSG